MKRPYRHRSLRERVNRHLKDVDAREQKKPCRSRREGDEMACHCGARWPVGEDHP